MTDKPKTARTLAHMNGLAALTNGAIRSPFTRLRALLDGHAPGIEPTIQMTIGEPRETMPEGIAAHIAEAEAKFAKYPPIHGTDVLRETLADWLTRRFAISPAIDPATEVLPVTGSREALYFAALPALGRKAFEGQPAIAMCNPYYATYIGAVLGVGAEPVFLNATADTGHLPDLDALAADTDLLQRLAAIYIASPANPQGTVASPAYIAQALALARAHDIILFFDECYSEIYNTEPPTGALEVAAKTPERFANLVVFNSLSKRSNVPGLRSGLCAGDPQFLAAFREIRNLVAPQMPLPIQHASVAIWSDETHVEATRDAYRAKYDVCDAVLGGRFGYVRPAGGFFLWLDVAQNGGGAHAAVTLWKEAGVMVIPGAYLAQPDRSGVNPGDNYIRLALVHEPDVVRDALERVVNVIA